MNTSSNIRKDNRKRSRGEGNHSSSNEFKILRGVSLCVSGLPTERKNELHSMVVRLGGMYTRDLFTSKTTHLLVEQPEGAKFKEALKTGTIEILLPEWLEMCWAEKKRLPSKEFRLVELQNNLNNDYHQEKEKDLKQQEQHLNSGNHASNEQQKAKSKNTVHCNDEAYPDILRLPLNEACEKMLSDRNFVKPSLIFSRYYFFFVGFDDEINSNGDVNHPFIAEDQSAISSLSVDKTLTQYRNPSNLKQNLSKLARRGMATNLWEVDDKITHYIVDDHCDVKLRLAVLSCCRQHLNKPVAVSPLWVLSSLVHGKVQNFRDFVPQESKIHKRQQEQNPSQQQPIHTQPKQQHINPQESLPSVIDQNNSTKNVFQSHHHFCLIKLPSMNCEHLIYFDHDEIQRNIISNGGCILTKQTISLFQKDRRDIQRLPPSTNSKIRHHCFVIILGGNFIPNDILQNNPMLSIIHENNLADITFATPIWIQTCIHDKMMIEPTKLPSLFQPLLRPLRKLFVESLFGEKENHDDSTTKSLNPNRKEIKISVSGFVGSERTALNLFLTNLGATYTESMSLKNTHLICKEPTGNKYTKAMEWGLKVVSIEWLYHIAQFGYAGEKNEISGCEDQFSFTKRG